MQVGRRRSGPSSDKTEPNIALALKFIYCINIQMSSIPFISDPTNLDGLRKYLASVDPDSRLSPLDMQRVEISDTAHVGVKAAVAEALAAMGKIGRASVVILTYATPTLHAAAAVGLHADIRAAADAMTGLEQVFKPEADAHQLYSGIFKAYRSIYPNLKSTFRLIAESAT